MRLHPARHPGHGNPSDRSRGAVILAPHWTSSRSMHLHAELLRAAYEQTRVRVRVLTPPGALSRRVRTARLRKLLAYFESLLLFPLTLLLHTRRSELLHVTDHSDALWLLFLPRHQRRAAVVTCHDLVAVRAARGLIGEHRSRWTGRLYQRAVVAGLSRASRVLAVSRTTAADVRSIVPSVDCAVVRLPVDPALMASTSPAARTSDRRFALVVSSGGWRKARHRAYTAFLAIRTYVDLDLVLIGEPPTQDELTKLTTAQRADLLRHLDRRSSVSPGSLADLYSRAEFLIQLSLHEGFGWPILESNWFARVAICTDMEVFREMGAGNVYVGPDLEEVDWAAVVEKVRSEERRQQVRTTTSTADVSHFAADLRSALSMLLASGDR